MGRLFWKFFLLITLVQLVSVVAVGVAIALDGHYHHDDEEHFSATHSGAPRPPPRTAQPPPGAVLQSPGAPPAMALAQRPEPSSERRSEGFFIPIQPIIGGLFASLASAALLAWFLSKPIRGLRDAFAAASTRHLGQDFDRMVERLQTLVNGQRRLLHDVSHEMRSPLARMQAAIGLASQQPEQTREAMTRIEHESVRMDRLIGELLALSRLQAGFTGRMDDDIDLRELLAVINDDASFEARARKRTVQADVDLDAVVKGNVELLRRALENVMRNAIKFSYDGGVIGLSVRLDHALRAVAIRVCDAGPGVPDTDLAAIFEPFFRGLNGGNAEGHGLGLAIAKRIVEAHGGTIRAENLAAGGLCVEIVLPLAPG